MYRNPMILDWDIDGNITLRHAGGEPARYFNPEDNVGKVLATAVEIARENHRTLLVHLL